MVATPPAVTETQQQTTPETTPHATSEKTLDSTVDQVINADSMQTEIPAPKRAVTVPSAAHGKWLIVEKQKRKQNQNPHPGFAKSKENNKGNRFQPLSDPPEVEMNHVTVAANTVSTGQGNLNSNGGVNAKKRSRRDDGKQSLAMVQQPATTTEKKEGPRASSAGSGQGNSNSKSQTRTKRIGDKIVYDIGGVEVCPR